MRQVHKTVTVIEHDRRRPQKAKLAGKFQSENRQRRRICL
jgi:hypothetical protein